MDSAYRKFIYERSGSTARVTSWMEFGALVPKRQPNHRVQIMCLLDYSQEKIFPNQNRLFTRLFLFFFKWKIFTQVVVKNRIDVPKENQCTTLWRAFKWFGLSHKMFNLPFWENALQANGCWIDIHRDLVNKSLASHLSEESSYFNEKYGSRVFI